MQSLYFIKHYLHKMHKYLYIVHDSQRVNHIIQPKNIYKAKIKVFSIKKIF